MRRCSMATRVLSVLSITFVLSYASANAQPDGPKTGATTATVTTVTRSWSEPATRWQKGSDLIGKNVHSSQADKLGDVNDMIIDLDSGRVLYYIVGCDGDECAIPGMAMTLPPDAKQFMVPATKDQVKVYSFGKKNAPDFRDRGWATQLHTHYKVQPVWEETPLTARDADKEARLAADRTIENAWYRFPLRTQRASELIGMEVRNQQNEDLGKIEDLAIDPDAGRVIYGVLSFGGFLGMGDKFFAIPWSSLKQVAAAEDYVTLDLDKDRLKNASGFDKKNWPNMADQRWATEVHTFYETLPYWVEPSKNRDGNRP